VTEKIANQPNTVSRYLKETRGELRKVTWPTREESQRLTIIVIGVTIAFALFLWVFDLLFSNAVQLLIEQIIGL
jgi:preprotein translocase subunit SecE